MTDRWPPGDEARRRRRSPPQRARRPRARSRRRRRRRRSLAVGPGDARDVARRQQPAEPRARCGRAPTSAGPAPTGRCAVGRRGSTCLVGAGMRCESATMRPVGSMTRRRDVVVCSRRSSTRCGRRAVERTRRRAGQRRRSRRPCCTIARSCWSSRCCSYASRYARPATGRKTSSTLKSSRRTAMRVGARGSRAAEVRPGSPVDPLRGCGAGAPAGSRRRRRVSIASKAGVDVLELPAQALDVAVDGPVAGRRVVRIGVPRAAGRASSRARAPRQRLERSGTR